MAKHAPGPWNVCGDGNCSCSTVMASWGPIATVTRGDWGDDYPAIRHLPPEQCNGLSGTAVEAFMEQITYGHVDDVTAIANCHLISSSPDLYDALRAIMEHHGPGTLASDEIYENAVKALCKARGETFPETQP